MWHADIDTLAVVALGEPIPADVAEHLRECAHCRAELAALTSVADTARAAGPEPLTRPPAEVWNSIALGVDDVVPPPAAVWDSIAAGTHDDERATPTPVVGPAEARRPSGRVLVAVSALLGAAAGVAGTLLWPDPPPTSDRVVVARAELEPLAETPAGRAQVTEDAQGRQLAVELDADLREPGYLEVWLLTEDAQGLVPVGTLRGSESVLALPEGIDLGEFPVVDVSIEPFDGDPGHSGQSVVRGRLTPSS